MGVSQPVGSAAVRGTGGPYGPLRRSGRGEVHQFPAARHRAVRLQRRPDGVRVVLEGRQRRHESFNTALPQARRCWCRMPLDLGLSVTQEPERTDQLRTRPQGQVLRRPGAAQAAAYWGTWTDQLNNRSASSGPARSRRSARPRRRRGFANTGESGLWASEVELTARGDRAHRPELRRGDERLGHPVVTSPSSLAAHGHHRRPVQGQPAAPDRQVLGQFRRAVLAPMRHSWDDGEWFARADLSWKDKQYRRRGEPDLDQGAHGGELARRHLERARSGVDAYVLNAFDDDNYVSIHAELAADAELRPDAAKNGNLHLRPAGAPHLRRPVSVQVLRRVPVDLETKGRQATAAPFSWATWPAPADLSPGWSASFSTSATEGGVS